MSSQNPARRVISVLVSIAIVLTGFLFAPPKAEAAFADVDIQFSNIGGGSGAFPSLLLNRTVTGKKENDKIMVRVDDLITYMGVSDLTNVNQPTIWRLSRNGQTMSLTEGSTSFTTSINYEIINPQSQSVDARTVTWSGQTEYNTQKINGVKYVELKTVALQLGCLTVGTASNVFTVFDFRVSNASPLADSNVYVVGGPWLTDWTSKGSTSLSNNYKASDFWDRSTSYTLSRQLKMSMRQIQAAENIRFHYNNLAVLNISSGFRCWDNNRNTSGSWNRSFHMRGRAFDVSNSSSLYTSIYNEFKGSSTQPLVPNTTGFWRTRVTNGKSGGYEIEQMPVSGSTWLHLQTQPDADSMQ
jgi:hypothetical protein